MRDSRTVSSSLSIAAMLLACLLLGAASATAATRYAAPGGTGADPCGNPAQPCSLYVAAHNAAPGTTIESGDVVELAPGTYSEADEDLGPTDLIQPPTGITVRGAPGAARPVIVLEANNGGWGAFFLGPATVVEGVEIRNQATNGSALAIQGGAIERVIARSSLSTGITCNTFEGEIRSSACINRAGGVAIGASVATFAGVHATIIRNSTALATGTGSVGIDFAYFASSPGVIGAVNAIGVIAKGEAKDVIARGMELNGGHGATTTIELQASDYATTDTKTAGTGSASVATPGTNGNITAPPLLADDGFHQRPGSPTIDHGAIDGASAGLDIDGQLREIGLTPDIGADEIGNPTETRVLCSPPTIALGAQSTCTVTVEDVGTALTQPSGMVSLSGGPGLGLPPSCTLVVRTEADASCSVGVSSTALGAQSVSASFAGDQGHEGSEGGTMLNVAAPLVEDPARTAPQTKFGKHPAKKTSKRLAVFRFSSDQPGSSFRCKLDKKPYRPCRSPFKRKVAEGRHTFRVRAVSAAGIADPTPAKFSWKVELD